MNLLAKQILMRNALKKVHSTLSPEIALSVDPEDFTYRVSGTTDILDYCKNGITLQSFLYEDDTTKTIMLYNGVSY